MIDYTVIENAVWMSRMFDCIAIPLSTNWVSVAICTAITPEDARPNLLTSRDDGFAEAAARSQECCLDLMRGAEGGGIYGIIAVGY